MMSGAVQEQQYATEKSFVESNDKMPPKEHPREALGLMVSQLAIANQEVNKRDNKISLKDKIVMGPIDRYKKYNHFPWKLLLHIMLLFVTSFQVLSIVSKETDFAYNGQLQYFNKFMTTEWNG
jgi:hypothetical protein